MNVKGLEFLELPMELSSIDPVTYQYMDHLLNKRTIVFNDEVGDNIVETVMLPLKKFERDDSQEPVTLILSTCGGSVFDAMSLLNMIDGYKKPLKVVCINYAMSMGFYMLIAGNNNPNVETYCYPYSFGLLHAGEIGVNGETNSVKDTILFSEKMDEMIKDFVLSHTKITEEDYSKHLRKQWYMSAPEMKELGVVENIIGVDCEDY